jgi:hypothetical protein
MLTLVGGCGRQSAAPAPPEATSASSGARTEGSAAGSTPRTFPVAPPASVSPAPLAPNIPVSAASVSAAVNRDGLPPYQGATGSVQGTVRVSGDPAPEAGTRIPSSCSKAEPIYGKVFREGPGREAADVMVAVTGYEAFVPAREPAVKVAIKDCAFDTRTVVVTFGQRIEVTNADPSQAFVPYLLGDPSPAHMVAVPGSREPVKLYPARVGRYVLADELNHPWMKAEVFVLKYATHSVTGTDGRYRIDGLPVGKLRVSAFLPAIGVSSERDVTVEEAKVATADFELAHKKGASRAEPAAVPPRKGPVIK